VTAGSEPPLNATRRRLRILLTALLAASALLVSWSTAGAWSTADGTVTMIPMQNNSCQWGGGTTSVAVDAAGNMHMTGMFLGGVRF